MKKIKNNQTLNEIKGQMQDTQNRVIGFKILITQGRSVTVFDNVAYMRKFVALSQRKGNKNVTYNENEKCIITEYPGKSKKDITKEIARDLNKLQINVTSQK